jgi:hypothetical protein
VMLRPSKPTVGEVPTGAEGLVYRDGVACITAKGRGTQAQHTTGPSGTHGRVGKVQVRNNSFLAPRDMRVLYVYMILIKILI